MAVPYCSEGNSDRNPPSQHPISPPQELVQQWMAEPEYRSNLKGACMMISLTEIRFNEILAKVAQWGADQEREACCEWLNYNYPSVSTRHLRDARRPKALSLKERALDDLKAMTTVPPGMSPLAPETVERIERIRLALEELPDD